MSEPDKSISAKSATPQPVSRLAAGSARGGGKAGADARDYAGFWEPTFNPATAGERHGKADLPASSAPSSEWEQSVSEELARQLATWREAFVTVASRLQREDAAQKKRMDDARARYQPMRDRLQREPHAPMPVFARNMILAGTVVCAAAVFALVPNRIGLHWTAAMVIGAILGAVLAGTTGFCAYLLRHRELAPQRLVAYSVLVAVLFAWVLFGAGYPPPDDGRWLSALCAFGMALACVMVGLATYLSDDEEIGYVEAHRTFYAIQASISPTAEQARELQARHYRAMQTVQEAAHRAIMEYRRANREQRRTDRPPPAFFDQPPAPTLRAVDEELPIAPAS